MRAPGCLGAGLEVRLGAWRALRPRAPHAAPAHSGRSGPRAAGAGPLMHPAAPKRADDRAGCWFAGPGAAGGRDTRSRGPFEVRLSSSLTPPASLGKTILIRPLLPGVFYGSYICITMDALDAHTRALSIGWCPRGGGAEAGSCGYFLRDRGRWSQPAPDGVVRRPRGVFQHRCQILGPVAPVYNLLPQFSSSFIDAGNCEFLAQPLPGLDLAFTGGNSTNRSVG